MKRVLCISPHFPPVNAPDMQRLRQSLPYFREFGWEPVVLAVDPMFVELDKDSDLAKSVEGICEIHWTKALSQSLTQKVGLGNLGIRCLPYILADGSKLLEKQKYDLIYFSTTVFDCIPAGRIWKRRHRVPFVVDLQDPWRKDFYLSQKSNRRPPKFWFDYHIKKLTEAWTMPHCDGMTSVSPGYLQTMVERYGMLEAVPRLMIPFGADPIDFEYADKMKMKNTVFSKLENNIDIVFTGAMPPSNEKSLRAFLLSAQRLLRSGLVKSKLRFHFVGTSYVPRGKGAEQVMPIAREYGLELEVNEVTRRVPYFEAVKIVADADLLFLAGSVDSAYSASKTALYALSNRPIIAIINSGSDMGRRLSAFEGHGLVEFSNDDQVSSIALRTVPVLAEMLNRLPYRPKVEPRALMPMMAKEKTAKLAAFFSEVEANSVP